MKLLPLIEVIVVNALLIPLLVLISENYALRDAYWGREGFTSTTVRYPFFFITSAVKGTTNIPGLLSVDWQQVIFVLLVAVDVVYILSALRGRERPVIKTEESPQP